MTTHRQTPCKDSTRALQPNKIVVQDSHPVCGRRPRRPPWRDGRPPSVLYSCRAPRRTFAVPASSALHLLLPALQRLCMARGRNTRTAHLSGCRLLPQTHKRPAVSTCDAVRRFCYPRFRGRFPAPCPVAPSLEGRHRAAQRLSTVAAARVSGRTAVRVALVEGGRRGRRSSHKCTGTAHQDLRGVWQRSPAAGRVLLGHALRKMRCPQPGCGGRGLRRRSRTRIVASSRAGVALNNGLGWEET
jgi:hypothetical protein